MSRMMDPLAVATRLGVDRKTVYKLIHGGALPARRIGPRVLRIAESDLENFLAGPSVSVTALDSERLNDAAIR